MLKRVSLAELTKEIVQAGVHALYKQALFWKDVTEEEVQDIQQFQPYVRGSLYRGDIMYRGVQTSSKNLPALLNNDTFETDDFTQRRLIESWSSRQVTPYKVLYQTREDDYQKGVGILLQDTPNKYEQIFYMTPEVFSNIEKLPIDSWEVSFEQMEKLKNLSKMHEVMTLANKGRKYNLCDHVIFFNVYNLAGILQTEENWMELFHRKLIQDSDKKLLEQMSKTEWRKLKETRISFICDGEHLKVGNAEPIWEMIKG